MQNERLMYSKIRSFMYGVGELARSANKRPSRVPSSSGFHLCILLPKGGGMKRIVWGITGWLTLLVTAQAASFPCHSASTRVEKLICSDGYLSTLDDKLHEAYNDISQADGAQISQRKWLKQRDRCNDIDCLRQEYEARIKQLTSEPYDGSVRKITIEPRKGTLPLISEAKAKSICKEVLELANAGKLQSRLLRFTDVPQEDEDRWSALEDTGGTSVGGALDIDYNHDKKIDHLGVIRGGGTCSSADIVDLGAALKRGALIEKFIGFSAQDDETLRWASWDLSDSLLIVQGEPIILAANFFVTGTDVELVSWFGEGQQRPLCAFSPVGMVVDVVESKAPELCNAVAKGSFDSLEPDVDEVNEQEQTKLREKYLIDGAYSVNVDLNADGKTDKVLFLNYSSGAGCGSYREWIDVLQPNAEKSKESPLVEIVGNFSDPRTKYENKWGHIQLLNYSGKPYLMANGPDGFGVYSVWENKIQTWCKFNLREQMDIKRLYSPN